MKNKTPYLAIAISFIVFNLIAFIIPSKKTSVFWIAYIFSVIAFGVLCWVWRRAIDRKQDLKSKFLGFPVTYISIVYMIVQTIAFIIFKFVTVLPAWCAVLICALILCISAVCMITTSAGTEIITKTEQKIVVKRQFIKDLQIEVEMLADGETDTSIKQLLNELAKKIRYSDPMSDSSLADLEDELTAKVTSIEHSSDKSTAISEAETLLLKRNKKVKALKG